MRLIKMFGLAALAAVAAMAFIGASSASAKFNTALCKTHTSLTCPAGDVWQGTETIHGVNEGVGTLLSDLVNILCLTALINIKALGLSKAPTPLSARGEGFFSECGTTSSHNNCIVTVEEQPLGSLLKTGLAAGTLTGETGLVRIKCEDIFGFINMDCKYDATGIEFEGEGLTVTTNETPVGHVEGSGLCPEESFIDGKAIALLQTPVHILQ